MFPYNGDNRTESKATRMFRPVRQVAEPGAKSAVSDCALVALQTTIMKNRLRSSSSACMCEVIL